MSSLPMEYHCAPCPVNMKHICGEAEALMGSETLADLASPSREDATQKAFQGSLLLCRDNVHARRESF